MKKIQTLSFILLASVSFGQAFTATYDFASVTSTSGLTDPSPVPIVTGLSFGKFAAVNPTATNSSGAGRLGISNQPLGATNAIDTYSSFTGAIDLGIYFEVTITPEIGYTMDLSKITFGTRRSATGTRNYAVRSSVDGFATNLAASINPTNANLSVVAGNVFFWNFDAASTATDQTGSTVTLGGANFTKSTNSITFRIYAWNAESVSGNFSVDNVMISGTTTAPALSIGKNTIAGLNVYPNPVTNGVLYITSKSQGLKSVLIHDPLGKQVLSSKTTNNSINVSNLKRGVYIVKVSEDGKTDTKKLIVNN